MPQDESPEADAERTEALKRLVHGARDIASKMRHLNLCNVHGPVALLGGAYIAAARAAGMSDVEMAARLHWLASQTPQHDPAHRPH